MYINVYLFKLLCRNHENDKTFSNTKTNNGMGHTRSVPDLMHYEHDRSQANNSSEHCMLFCY